MIKLENINITAGDFSLTDISLSIESGQCGVIIGPTGCGKSLLLQSIVGFKKINKGEIFVNNIEISKLAIDKRGIAYLPQEATLFPHLNVEDNIFYGLNINKIKDEARINFTNELCDLLGITHLFKRNIQNLSGGEQQRIAIARALAPGYKILLLDEPFSALNESFKKELWLLIKQLQEKFSLTILVVTHDIEEAFFLGDTIHVLIDGKFLRSGKKDKIYRYPKSEKVAKFLGISNIFDIKVISETTEYIEVFSKYLNSKLHIAKNRIKNQNLELNSETKAGIRDLEISIIKPGKIKEGQDNILKAIVQNIYLKGNSHSVIFRIENTNYIFDIEVPDRAFKSLKIKIGEEREISFRSDSIFILDLE